MNPPVKVSPLPSKSIEVARNTYRELCHRFVDDHEGSPYRDYIGAAYSNSSVLNRQVRAFEIYASYIADGSSVMDWGCRHAPDSCMLRSVYPDIAISGCDTMDDDFSTFHQYAKLNFTLLRHEFNLPYNDSSFDTVVSGGVLEHVAFERESIKEVWRVLKDNGLFVVTFLPNRWSWSENASRALRTMNGHNRLYTLSGIKATLLRCGFSIETSGYHQIFPTLGKNVDHSFSRRVFTTLTSPLNRSLERVPIVKLAASNIFIVARKVRCL